MRLELQNLDEMSPAQERAFMAIFDAQLANDDGSEARAHLNAGEPIYYAEFDTPAGMVIKEYPGGRRELVSFMSGTEEVVEVLEE
ncbi:hypothetical protein [Photorhabdus hainanensis]|uniref:hypothetical protein n=1 Tax=Photorhabdus hainanensis TaxID=1004166 RepID=UPI001BD5850F|nr:hypothetical protein [Photorhabdus hainanensis]MBS9435037.1 hypothetical protein [Photorhabdus hainanensis]